MPLGYLTLVLHAHLPFVRHPEFEDFLEEDWLYEAMAETYIPLLEVFDNLERDGVQWRLTMSITPTLASMLEDPLLSQRFVRYINNLIVLAKKEVERTRWEPEFYKLAKMYLSQFEMILDRFENRHKANLLHSFKKHFDSGSLELITSAATHGFLPLLSSNPGAVRAQIEIGVKEFERHFGRKPKGIWLPECGYIEGLEKILEACGVSYFFTDTHGVLFAEPRPTYGIYAPIQCTGSSVFAFGRDTEPSKQVWSALEGYPGDYAYREFYHDIGFDLDFEYLRPHLHQIGIRTMTGIKYFRITGRSGEKKPYHPEQATEKAAEHAGNFLFNREKQVEWLSGAMKDRPALIVAPYDAELFGHWWFEGPQWLDFLFRKMHFDQKTIKCITVPEYLEKHPNIQHCRPVMSSWGNNGYSEVWLEASNDWIYMHLHACADRMEELASNNLSPDPINLRALNQALRELLLAQSSDWAFIIKAGTTVDYAVNRTRVHILNFLHLYEQITEKKIDEPWLTEVEARHNLFPNIDYRVFSSVNYQYGGN